MQQCIILRNRGECVNYSNNRLSQFEGEREMLFAPRTHLQVLKTGSVEGITIVTLKPTTYQNVCTVEVELAAMPYRYDGLGHCSRTE